MRARKGVHGGHMGPVLGSCPVDEQQGLTMKDNPTGFAGGERFLTDNTKVLNIMTGRVKMSLIELRKSRGRASLESWKDRVEFETGRSPSNHKHFN